MSGLFEKDPTGSRMVSSQPTSPPPTLPVFSRPGTGPRPTPAPQAQGAAVMSTSAGPTVTGALPTNEEIEAKIQAAMSSASNSRSSANPPRDTRTQLFVGNLPYRVRWQDLKDLFRRAGTVLRADVSLGPDNRSRGYGTVMLATAEDAGRAIDMFNGYVWQTRTLEVRPDRMGVGGGVGVGVGLGMGGVGGVGMAGGMEYGFSGVGAGAGGPESYGAGESTGSSTPFNTSRLGSTSPFLGGDEVGTAGNLAAQLARVASPGSNGGVSLNSPLLPGANIGVNGISLNSPRAVQSQLTGQGGERSRNLFVGNLPFHIQWQDLKDLFRQAGTILRADVALGPDGRSRGFGTVSYATEADADRAVKMFNGYDFNGRQLKVHFDKFAVPSGSTIPMIPGISMPMPQSPTMASFSNFSTHLSHASMFAQQLFMHQRSDPHRQGQEQQHDFNPMLAFQRANTDQALYQSPLSPEEGSFSADFGLDGAPNPLMRAQSDSVPQFLHSQPPPLPPRRNLPHTAPQTDASTPAGHLQQQSQLRISLPAFRPPPYAYDFSPGSPYTSNMYSTSNMPANMGMPQPQPASAGEGADGGVSAQVERDVMQPGSAFERGQQEIPFTTQVAQSQAQAQEQATGASPSTQEGEQSSQPTSSRDSQPATQATSPSIASPSSLHSHPAHPGPIALPPPVTAFAIPPSLSPVYHPQMSPYASPLNHPGVMMSMNMTPYGLPPITPSMPSFQFVPQPSPGSAPAGGSTDLLSPAGIAQAGPGLSPGIPLDPHAQDGSAYGMPPPPPPHHLRAQHGVMLSPYTPFSPGVTMSPGAFWGRAGSGGVNPYINPAVGAPVHAVSGYFPPVPQPQPQVQARMEEPQGYFPPFLPANAPLSAGQSQNPNMTLKPTTLSQEITHSEDEEDGEGVEKSMEGEHQARPDSTGSDETTPETGTLTGTEASPRPTSSTGTSWHTDPAGSSSPTSGELEKGMQALTMEPEGDAAASPTDVDDTIVQKPSPRPCAAPRKAVRADSDPVQGSASMGELKVDSPPHIQTNGRSISDTVAAC